MNFILRRPLIVSRSESRNPAADSLQQASPMRLDRHFTDLLAPPADPDNEQELPSHRTSNLTPEVWRHIVNMKIFPVLSDGGAQQNVCILAGIS